MKTAPWVLVVVLFATLVIQRSCDSGAINAAVDAANAAQDSLAVLEPLVDSLRAEALRMDTVLVTVTDSVEVVVERVRVEVVELVDSLHEHVDSVGAVYVEQLLELHAEEVASIERLSNERLLWGRTWQSTAELLARENEQLRISSDQWQRAFDQQRRQSNVRGIGGLGLAALAVFAFVHSQ